MRKRNPLTIGNLFRKLQLNHVISSLVVEMSAREQHVEQIHPKISVISLVAAEKRFAAEAAKIVN